MIRRKAHIFFLLQEFEKKLQEKVDVLTKGKKGRTYRDDAIYEGYQKVNMQKNKTYKSSTTISHAVTFSGPRIRREATKISEFE